MKYYLIIWFAFTTTCSFSQFLDTLQVAFKSKASIDARLETRNSFITNQRAKITGVRLGVTFQKKIRIGGGISWLASNISEPLTFSDAGKSVAVYNQLKLGYLCYYIDFVFHKTKRWQLSVPIQAGTGLSWFQYQHNNQLVKSKKYFLLLYEPGITVQFKVFKWLGVGTDIGYRFTLKNNAYVGNKLNSPTYAFKLLVWFDQLFYEVVPKNKLTLRYGPAQW